jgi:hypothetical protein
MSTLKKLKAALDAAERHHLDALDTLDSETAPKTALAETRRSIKASRAHLDEARAICLKLMKGDAPDEELSLSRTRRSTALARLDAAPVGRVGNPAVRPRPAAPPAALGGGAHLTQQVREDELRRLRAMW